MSQSSEDHRPSEQSETREKKVVPGGRGGTIEEYRLVPVDSYDFDGDREIIDIMGLLKDLWVNRSTIFFVTLLCLAIGIISFIGSERIYYSETKLMPESTGSSSQLGQLFQQYENIFGIQSTQDSEDIRVGLYPFIVESIPFQIELMQHEVYFSNIGQRVTIFEYFTEHEEKSLTQIVSEGLWDFTIGLPATLYRAYQNWTSDPQPLEPIEFSELTNFETPLQLDNRIRSVAERVGKLITVEREPQTGFVSIGVSLPDPKASSEMVVLVRNLLQEYVVDYRTEKAMKNLEFIEEQVEEAEENFRRAQESLAEFQDRNVNIQLQSVAVTEQRLQSEFDLSYSLYNTLARRLQEAKIQVQEQTPVFRIHEPATIPRKPAQPRAARMLIGSLFVGFFFGVASVYLKRIIRRFVREFKSKDPKPYFS